jgi:hypothetical protein
MMIKRPRVKDDKHLAFIRDLPCCICGDNTTTEAAHLRSGSYRYGKPPTGGSEKPSDRWTIPLCGRHHRQQHSMQETVFWEENRIDPYILAMSLHGISGDHEMASHILERQRGIQ